MNKIKKRRKPRLDEKRVEVIAATFEAEVGSANFEIRGIRDIRVCCDNANEWQVIMNSVLSGTILFDGGDKLIMVNDQTGKARYYSEYEREQRGALREKQA